MLRTIGERMYGTIKVSRTMMFGNFFYCFTIFIIFDISAPKKRGRKPKSATSGEASSGEASSVPSRSAPITFTFDQSRVLAELIEKYNSAKSEQIKVCYHFFLTR